MIDQDLRQYLDEQAAEMARSPQPASDAERVQLARAGMEQVRSRRGAIPGLPNSVASEDVEIRPGLTARVYTPLYTPPETRPNRPAVVYMHGGGWVVGSIETHDPFCRLLSERGDAVVVSVQYRLAPEYPYPAALDDTLVAAAWCRERWERLVLGGDSAGGNLAAAAAQRLCGAGDDGEAAIGLLLLYPVTDQPDRERTSYRENATGYGLEAEMMAWFWRQYAAGLSTVDEGIAPLRARSLPRFPPTLIATAEYDVLRDEGLAYKDRLKQAGVEVTHLHAPDMHHNFAVHPGTVMRFPQSVAALDAMASWLRAL